jgi:hypothetical protein
MDADFIKVKVSSDPLWAERAITALWRYQTAHEQIAGETNVKNGVGFNGNDAHILTSFAEQINRKESQGVPAGRRLSPKQLVIAYKKLPKYAKQLFRIANA